MKPHLLTWWERFRGIGEASPAIPPLDGPYDPNNALEEAEILLQTNAPDNLFEIGGQLQFTDGARRYGLGNKGEIGLVEDHATRITAAAGFGASGGLVGLAGGALVHIGSGGARDQGNICMLAGDITALVPDGKGAVVACVGSRVNDSRSWTRDLLEKRRTGSVLRVNPNTGEARELCAGLGYPNGAFVTSDGSIVVAEAWRNRLVEVGPDGSVRVLVDDLPGYPARIAPASGGGAWLAMMAPRNQLLEFMLREDRYRARMLAEVDPPYWIAPSLTRAQSYLEPMQQGAQRSLGMLKPWSPSLSIGMVTRFDAKWSPMYSLFSRADGRMHGVRSVLEHDDRLLVASTGGGAVLSLPLDSREDVA